MYIAICDDEKDIREMLTEKVQRLYPEAVLRTFSSGEELLASRRPPDILLLDIQMSGRNGMETARELRRNNKRTVLIFVTALEDYVFQAFDVGAFHYLVKPFDDSKFAKVLHRAAEEWAERQKPETVKTGKEAPPLMITTGGEHITVSPADILYAEVYNRKIILHTTDQDIEYYGKMKDLEKKVGDAFYRTHRAYLVNFNFIRKYDSTTVCLTKGQALMAKQNYGEFVKCYLRYNQKKGRQ